MRPAATALPVMSSALFLPRVGAGGGYLTMTQNFLTFGLTFKALPSIFSL